MKHLFAFLALTVASAAYAGVSIDKSVTPKQAQAFIKPLLETVVRPYGEKLIPTYKKENKIEKWGGGVAVKKEGQNNFLWLIDRKPYLSHIAAWVDDDKPTNNCKKRLIDEGDGPTCHSVIEGSDTCFLFMLSRDGNIENTTKLNINRGELVGKPHCHEIKAMAPSGTIRDGMLITLQYHDSTWLCSVGIDCANDVEKPDMLTTTLLIRFKHNASGQLISTQDDSCFGNPNGIKTIAQAKAVIQKKCCQ